MGKTAMNMAFAEARPIHAPIRNPISRNGLVDCESCTIRPLAMCSALNNDGLHRIEEIVRQVSLTPNQMLFLEGDPAKHVYNIVAGTLRVSKQLADGRRQITGFLFAGDFVGLGGAEGYSYSAEAVTPVTLCRFRWHQLGALFEAYPKLERRLFGMAVDELAAAQEQFLLLGRKSARERVASFLLQLSERAERRGLSKSPVRLPMTRADIADYLGLTTETVSRSFSALKRDGVIEVPDSHQVVLHDIDALDAIAEGDRMDDF
jgi:CRP/FNR family transcriptional regulator